MNAFTLHIQSATQYEVIERVASFVGEDASGSFGIEADHERFVTVLVPGLARFRVTEGPWQYVALTRGVIYFVQGALYLSTTRYARGTDHEKLRALLREALRSEQETARAMSTSLRRLEDALFRRLYDVERRV
jgi:F-type H+-transporting ATPase subunit epsilon